ncbi:glycoside hydrolase family 9 protein [Terriglobus aquaticus]|uniref:Endoglucanase n=1 Tax=Terriglobus aquaticus TaxID=940139 RepID=A0ABW9KGT9_9BACT|nr:glycoside hydrolase family 9 protein [Terriglobus aquaticus]
MPMAANDKSKTEGADGTVPRIVTNQCGYRPAAAKVASVVLAEGAPDRQDFTVESARGEVVLRGTLPAAARDAASGDLVALVDFSAVRTSGTYRIRTADAVSDPVIIAETAYGAALKTAMRAFYGQRCGCKVDLGGGYKHKACHKAGEFGVSSGKSGPVRNSGGWHDAGDYGRYVVNSGISTATLLYAWEMFPAMLQPLKLQIPESGGRVPDFLAEVRWNLQWMLSMQDPADGGVWHKQTSAAFCGFIMPERDDLPSQVIGTGSAPFKSTCATADLAAVAAIAARCYRPYDPKFAESCLVAARAAYKWARENPEVLFKNPPGVTTGEYGDRSSADEMMWAAAELFRTTGEAEFRVAFEAGLPAELRVTTPGWNNLMSFALWAYAMSTGANAALRDRIVSATRDAANALVEHSRTSGFGNTMEATDYVWGSNSVAANHALLLLMADRFQSDPAAREAALANLHYLLGRNCFGVSWVTGVGVRPFQHPHHRPSQADKIAAPWPGLLSGGPNAHGGDSVADKLPKRPPMRMWVDDWQAYSMNEVAINWNAPLVFLLAAANA